MLVEKSRYPSEIHSIHHKNWLSVSDVKASFSIGHNRSNIFLTYHVEEPHVRAVQTEFNSPVWEDSCVEFFFSPEEDYYYNFEINAIGTVLCAYGINRHRREHLSESVLGKITTEPSLGRKPIEGIWGRVRWSLRITIPLETFVCSRIQSLSGLEARGNFYKCGDKLDRPHYLSWNPVPSPHPDFHLPEHFGPLTFQQV
jgi:hypothetical protein